MYYIQESNNNISNLTFNVMALLTKENRLASLYKVTDMKSIATLYFSRRVDKDQSMFNYV